MVEVSIHAPARGATTSCSIVGASIMFQSTPPRGGRHHGGTESAREGGFNPRPRAGGDVPYVRTTISPPVSIHAPARGATRSSSTNHTRSRFQSTPPRGGRRVPWLPSPANICFNPRPRAGGDACECELMICVCVSIHAPARGATLKRLQAFRVLAVSIHAPARGATGWHLRRRLPRAVSIHAPARGATSGPLNTPACSLFQSTPPRGGRLPSAKMPA